MKRPNESWFYTWIREEHNRDHWLAVRDLSNGELESIRIPAGTDLKQLYIEVLARCVSDGWQIQRVAANSPRFLCHKERSHKIVAIASRIPSKKHPQRRSKSARGPRVS